MAALLLQHLGPLHRGEQVLVYLLAFGPFVLLGLTVWISRRRDAGSSRPVGQPGDDQPGDDQPGDDQPGDDRAEN